MKNINNYIIEKLKKINSKNIKKQYKYFPQNTDELKRIVKNLIKKRGSEANLNDIDVSNIDDLTFVFQGTKFNGDISYWDVSNVKTMHGMFIDSLMFTGKNTDFNNWDVSNVQKMGAMFANTSFNSDISEWDVSNVEDMKFMFSASKFNGDISKWNVSNVENMTSMFFDSSFNGDISNWDVSKVKSMYTMFMGCPLSKNPPKWYKN